MDQRAFGRLTTTLATATSRRAALRGAIAIFVGTGATSAVGDASAATRCRRGRQTCQRNSQCCSGTCQTGRGFSTRERNRCTCEDGLQVCSNACVDTDTDVRHCGACGNRCGAGDHCVDGECRIHQQCFTMDGGFCYMGVNGLEHRGDGFVIPEGFSPTTCTANLECRGGYATCDMPGVRCDCVRAVDFGGGYMNVEDPGSGICLPVLDNGDDGIYCHPVNDATICFYSSEGEEILLCEDLSIEQGPCDGYSCSGVGDCDEAGVNCACMIAYQIPTGPLDAIYLDMGDYEPTCVAYVSPVDGVCAPPS